MHQIEYKFRQLIRLEVMTFTSETIDIVREDDV